MRSRQLMFAIQRRSFTRLISVRRWLVQVRIRRLQWLDTRDRLADELPKAVVAKLCNNIGCLVDWHKQALTYVSFIGSTTMVVGAAA